ncbi:putative Cytosolic endo-beta-N-acetylglucosaminidase 2 [Paratrimastix pyriformis]|uniref:Cytosolic endo-beta-N-acetylglucosaminidase 2 n=1 Tax=Paratrimastix pyriformis TaxID=342808 RepID=A0ABQ8UX03_9EUKA|nr:putative Cytosolic endo-beta-N-acetylglucosaminidase 2 [Paratrimastix pyriformis]
MARFLDSAGALDSWKPEGPVAFSPAILFRDINRPRVVVCHDMCGGYNCDCDENYPMNCGWDVTDAFVYFSHHRVTIPPPLWIRRSHQHGVPILGTFITEWQEGYRENILVFCKSTEVRRHYARQLAAIAAHHGFDGWLVNIEAHLPPLAEIPQEAIPTDAPSGLTPHAAIVVDFLTTLRNELHARVGPHALVFMYDSITHGGRIQWQNGLTSENMAFFSCTDGFATNYCWDTNQLTLSTALAASTPASSLPDHRPDPPPASAPTDRRYDLLVGIDCFGRNTFYKEGAGCREAVDQILATGTSVFLFAPGWAKENCPKERRENWQLFDREFWDALGLCRVRTHQ